MHTDHYSRTLFFFTSSTPLSLTQNVDLFVNYHVFLVHGWFCLIVANFGKEKKNPQFFLLCPNVRMILWWLTGSLKIPEGPLFSNTRVI